MASALNKMSKLVFSRTMKDVGWRNSHLVRELDPGEIGKMKRQPGKDIIIFGSGSIVSQLTQHIFRMDGPHKAEPAASCPTATMKSDAIDWSRSGA
jgi:hypothetical protein